MVRRSNTHLLINKGDRVMLARSAKAPCQFISNGSASVRRGRSAALTCASNADTITALFVGSLGGWLLGRPQANFTTAALRCTRLSNGWRSLAGAVLIAATLVAPHAAAAKDVCVRCTGPDITYRCQVDGLDLGGLSGAGARLLCIQTLAKRGNHIRCAVDRQSQDLCPGLSVSLGPDDAVKAVAPLVDAKPDDGTPNPSSDGTGADAAQPASAGPKVAVEPPPPGYAPPATSVTKQPTPAGASDDAAQEPQETVEPGPPKTMEELAKRTAEQSGESFKKAGENVEAAAKKTWSCVTSLFFDC